ncbi:MOSC domain-containing protein [Peribacillus sp. SI8-4]|uniref:MOSC domain-containing protein n=1 Tax=Peribacillus sp. SI8-4 TaxID=3048009 RepID=UPI0025557A87|nr:MOSC domain-containing protein [Peribacillus sp. SI8-4]
MENEKKLVSLQVGKPKQESFANVNLFSAMDKRSVNALSVTKSGIVGDGVGDERFHGGPDRVICFYPYEHYALWNEKFSKKLDIPAFGENVTVAGMIEDATYIGDIYQIGEAIVQINQGRIPCSTISHFNREPGFLKLVMKTGFTGYFARVIKEGVMNKEDEILLLERQQEKISVQYATEVILHGRDGVEGARALLALDSLAEDWKKRAAKRIHAAKA